MPYTTLILFHSEGFTKNTFSQQNIYSVFSWDFSLLVCKNPFTFTGVKPFYIYCYKKPILTYVVRISYITFTVKKIYPHHTVHHSLLLPLRLSNIQDLHFNLVSLYYPCFTLRTAVRYSTYLTEKYVLPRFFNFSYTAVQHQGFMKVNSVEKKDI